MRKIRVGKILFGEFIRCSFRNSFRISAFFLRLENASKSIFMQPPNDSIARYKLKDGIQFHLFTSRAPCGDATAHYCKNNSEM